ncbi:5774_t:CDS:1, partial [Funneliformis mosseae]
WRNTPHLSVRNSLRHTWPGLSWGVGAFIIYLGADAVISRMNNQSNEVKPHSETKEES